MKIIYLLISLLLLYSCGKDDNNCPEQTWYQDADNDGFGNERIQVKDCEKPKGYTSDNTDCDDTNSLVHPNNKEIHNAVDDDCNALIDECISNADCNGICENGFCKEEDPQPVNFEFTKYHFVHDLTNTTIPYSFYSPKNSNGSTLKYPLIIALHGAEYFFSSEEIFLLNEETGYMALAWIEQENQENYPAYVLAPHLSKEINEGNRDYFGWDTETSTDFVTKLVDFLISNENIDQNRIYLTGHSMGGAGTWYLGAKLKDKLAAIVPLSNALSTRSSPVFEELISQIDKDCFKNIPIWNFIHRDDDGVAASRDLFIALSNKGYVPVYSHWFGDTNYNLTNDQLKAEIEAGKKFLHTEYNYPCYPGECHFAMTKALREPLLFEWLFKQRKN